MPAYWKAQLRQVIELTHEQIRSLEEEANVSDGAQRYGDTARRIIEAKQALVRLQQTIDALTVTEPERASDAAIMDQAS